MATVAFYAFLVIVTGSALVIEITRARHKRRVERRAHEQYKKNRIKHVHPKN